MPLKAKIANPALAGRTQQMSTEPGKGSVLHTPLSDTVAGRGDREDARKRNEVKESEQVISEWPGDEPEDVLFDSLFGLRTIELNRPKALHALNGSMIRKIVPRLREWAKSDMANVIVIKGSGEKAFCAGGDVTSLAKNNKSCETGWQKSSYYFALEYKLDHLIATYKKPYVAFLDGITMGGGVGLSIHAPFRIATERTLFAMPETTIGFFPDVGASFFLPRMPGAVGMYLALTSERLKGVNAYYAGVATHYIHSSALPALEKRLAELRFNDYDTLHERMSLINSTIEEYSTGLPHDEPIQLQGALRKEIDRIFGLDTLEEVRTELKILAGKNTSLSEWAKTTLKTLESRSPTSVYVTFRQMKIGQKWSIAETFKREHSIATKFMQSGEFTEGVDALLIRKDKNPQWKPNTWEEIQQAGVENVVAPYFRGDDSIAKLELLNTADYKEYPFDNFGIPHERVVEAMVKNEGLNKNDIIDHFLRKSNGKPGVKEVLTDILWRKTKTHLGKTTWIDEPKKA
ncbi:ClpP/crotonase-like domain-containing protein [Tricladium varicosporioides]|nr:ClpP/crotonase-like domain-containing protein [Hymenoscyphus varicosporioides]